MFPHFNSLASISNGKSSSAPQQLMANPPGNFAPNSMQMQPQMGLLNPQTAIPFSNPSSHFAPNQFFPIQAPQNLNYPMAMNQMYNMNLNPQQMPQFFNQNPIGPSNFLNQNLNLGLPNQLQDLNQIFQLQMQNFNPQAVPANLNFPQNVALVGGTQHANRNIPQNVGFVANTQMGFVDSSGIVQQLANSNASNGIPNATQQFQGSSSLMLNQKNFHPHSSNCQGNRGNVAGTKYNGKGPQYKNFKRNQKHEAPQNGLKPQFNKMQNAQGNFNSCNMQFRRENDKGGARQIYVANSAKQAQVEKKRSTSLHYTEKEIQQWREERRKNYPSKVNIEKKLKEKLTKPEVIDQVAKQRRQQLKEILAKQAQLGCEVAEIPSYYLSDSEQQVYERKDGRTLSKKERFQNKFNKRGRHNHNDRFSYKRGFANPHSSTAYSQNDHMAKKHRSANNDSVTHQATSKRDPTLLQKLLNADMRRDKHHLLQVFRFMVMNSFFKDWPKKPLKYPMVIVKETADEDELIDGKYVEGEVGGTDGILRKIGEPIVDDANDDNDDDCSVIKHEGLVEAVNSGQETGGLGGEHQEEEGEIID